MTTDPRKRPEPRVFVDADSCDGCGVCVFFCKPRVFQQADVLGARGYYVVVPVRPGHCTRCGACELGCPQLAIRVDSTIVGEGA